MNSICYLLGIVASVFAAVALMTYDDWVKGNCRRFWRVYLKNLRSALPSIIFVILVLAAIAFTFMFAASIIRRFC